MRFVKALAALAVLIVSVNANAGASLKCEVTTVDGFKDTTNGRFWLGHGAHLSVGGWPEYKLVIDGIEYTFEATFDASDRDFKQPFGSKVSISSSGYTAYGDTTVNLSVPGTKTWMGVKFSCELTTGI